MVEKLMKKNKVYRGSTVDLFCDKVGTSNGGCCEKILFGASRRGSGSSFYR
jgi:hypothetical protein